MNNIEPTTTTELNETTKVVVSIVASKPVKIFMKLEGKARVEVDRIIAAAERKTHRASLNNVNDADR